MNERGLGSELLPRLLRLFACALLLAGGLEGRQDEQAPEAPRPTLDVETNTAVLEHLAAGHDAALARVRDAKEAARVAGRESMERDARIELALRDATARTPLKVTLTESVTVENVRVTAYTAGQVTLTWPQGEVQYPLSQLPEETRAVLLAGALSKATPRDHFEFGKMMIEAKDYERAARYFATAAQRDPALAPWVPDLERVKKAARLFEGSFKAAGNALSLRWRFYSPAEAGDFVALQGTFSIRPNAGLEVEGQKLALTAVKEIPFRDRVKVSALAKETDAAAHLMGLKFTKPDGGEVLIYGALLTALKAFMVFRIEDEKSQEVLAPTPGAAGNRMTLDFNRGRISFQVGEKTVWSGSEGGFTDVMVILGGVSVPRPAGSGSQAPARVAAQFKEASLLGEVNPQWMAKKTAGLRDALSTELGKEYRTKREGGAALLDLCVEPALSRAAEPTRTTYQAALLKVAAMQKSLLREDLFAAQGAMQQVTYFYPAFAPGWYYRGVLAETAGDRREAQEHYRRAMVLLSAFPEAICAMARLQALDGKWEAARTGIERALALKPDLPEALLLKARLQWEARDAEGVIASTQIARQLAPLDPELQFEAQMLANVARGPRWVRTNRHATAHYKIQSDLPVAKCKLYAEHLEAIRGYYEEVLNRPLPGAKPAEVVIFNTEEGYYTYSDFTLGSRQEHTLGAFSPWSGQMALFEGVDPAETLWVLSHEGFHQFLHALAPDVPIWFNEGMAEYVGGAKVDKGRLVERGGILQGRLDNLKMAVKYGWKPVPFHQLMLESKANFYGELAPFKYAQAWSMIRYFMDGESGRYRGVMREYSDRLLAGDSAKAAFDATFAKQDLKAMEAGWLKHYGLVLTSKAAAPSVAKAAPDPPPGEPAREPPLMMEGGGSLGTDILRGVKPGVASGWTLKSGGIESSAASRVLDTGVPLPEEYDVSLMVELLAGEGDFFLGLRGGAQFFVLKMDGPWIGLEILDNNPGRNETSRRFVRPLMPKEPRLYTISVRKTGLQLTSSGTELFSWRGNFNRLSLSPVLRAISPAQNLFLGTTNLAVRISGLWFRKPEASGANPASAKAPEAADIDVLKGLSRSPIPAPGWSFKGSALESTAEAQMVDTGVPLLGNYDVSVTMERLAGPGEFYFGMWCNRVPFLMKIDPSEGISLEAVLGKNAPNESTRPIPNFWIPGKGRSLLISVRPSSVRVTSNDETLLAWGGENGLSMPSTFPGVVPKGEALFFGCVNSSIRISELKVKPAGQKGASGEGAAPTIEPRTAKITVDPERSIALGGDISRWVIDEENGQIWAIEPKGKLLQISIPERKIVRRITTGTQPISLNAVPGNSKMVWVGNAGGPELLKIDLEKGSIVETVAVPFHPTCIVAVRKYLWCLDVGGGLRAIDLTDKKDLGNFGLGRFVDLAYESRKDRLWALSLDGIMEMEVSKVVGPMRERTRPGGAGGEANQAISKATRFHAGTCRLDRGGGRGLVLDDKTSRLFMSGALYKTDKPDAQVQIFKAPNHSLEAVPEVAVYLSTRAYIKEIIAASPDGKWVASGTHLFSVANPTTVKELPVPSPLVAFSKDSTQLCYFDWINKVIAVMDIESK